MQNNSCSKIIRLLHQYGHVLLVIYVVAMLGYAYIVSLSIDDRLDGFDYIIPLLLSGVIIIIVTSVLINIVKQSDCLDKDIHNIYIVAAVGIYSLLLWIQTPLHTFDSEFHYDSSYVVSDMILGYELVDWQLGRENISFYEKRVEDNIADVPSSSTHDLLSAYKMAQNELFIMIDNDAKGTYLHEPYQRGVSSPLYFYLPQGIGFAIARVLGFSRFLLLYLGRFLVTIVSVILSYLSIKNAPRFKKIFFVSSLVPATMLMTNSLSRDSLIISVSYYYIAMCLKLIYSENRIKVQEYMVTLILLLLVIPYKIIYIPITMLLLLIINKNIRRGIWSKKYIIMVALVTIIGIVIFLYLNKSLIEKYIIYENNYSSIELKPAYNFTYVINNIHESVGIVFRTLIYNVVKYYGNMIAPQELGAGLSKEMVLGYSILLLLGAISGNGISEQYRGNYMRMYDRMIIILTVLLVILMAIVGFLFLTTVGSNAVIGVQGRYFTPIMPLIFVGLSSNKDYLAKLRINIDKLIVLCTYCLSLFVVINMYVWTISK